MVGQKWVNLTLTSLMVLATVFAVLALFTSWAYDGDPSLRATGFGFDGLATVTETDTVTVAMGSESLDDFDGIGLARAGAVLATIAVAFFIVGALAFENHLLTGRAWLSLTGLGAAGVGFLLWLVALILFPIGVNGLAESVNGGFFKPDLSWGAGLAFGIVAGVLSLATVVTAGVHRAITSGFRLEVADGSVGYANFD